MKSALVLSFLAFTLFSCSGDDNGTAGEDTAQLTVSMTDAPGDFDAVFIDVEDVMIKTDMDGTEDEGWESLGEVNTGRYDLLELTGGVTQVLADVEVPAGYLGQIRLVLGDDNAIVVDGEETAIAVPSAQQSGLKLQVDQELEAGEQYVFLLDFDVEESIVRQGNGGFSLKPVIRVSAQAGAGAIEGEVHPSETRSLVRAQNASTTISAYTDMEGNFKIHGVPAGTYKITVIPDVASNLPEFEEDNVVVEANETVNLETLYID
ncbi:DUF4382 domain-containing protein [Salegentibacter sp. F188]|uniref:DUF4382 domain-containing protein n=1 Tax=Autumnicola patrickiae TaxID=3075591 RepID=A0ABU3E5Q9_9FLAO|nr:DUF4382 domain-containing protein [Salegentibacter sp. F188]MDT0691275.1 DUF4382 domain-containing protein [Salegentibacter sp. F188]